MSKNFRTFLIDNYSYSFSVDAFKKVFNKEKSERCKNGIKCTAEMLREEIAIELNVSEETIKKWHQGANGPIDLSAIEHLADYFNINYMELLIKRKEECNMSKELVNNKDDERDVVLSVYHKLVEAAWLETARFNPEYFDAMYQEEGVFYKRHHEIYQDAFNIIDVNSLLISYETRIKLYNILSEARKSTAGMEAASGRWLRLNPQVYDARTYFNDGGFVEDEEEMISLLHKDAEDSIERPYCVEIDGCFVECFTKNTTKEEAASRIGNIAPEDIELVPYSDDSFGYQYSSEEIYRFEFIKTLILVFREDFPQYFSCADKN